ncbi:hypothetical protein FGG79_00040 [Bacillus sp. BHET2]|uniref:hypothetical protein n=1 Tax=Bacillus sp. BHET2 TaxID=2583818 RepID=UPI00110F0154|nr:hypothetical protein [Bacillus sp. BHET2]TMU86578.1 hypothetical protein FGG79_00040 [Bacillus sp. BHET2]
MPKLIIYSYLMLCIIVILEGLLIYCLSKRLNNFANRIQMAKGVVFNKGIPVGTVAPVFKTIDQSKKTIRVGPNMTSPIILIFVSATCPGCKYLLNNLRSNIGNLIFISNSDLDPLYKEKIQESEYSYLHSPFLFSKYQLSGVPRAILINKQGVIEEAIQLQSWENLTKTNTYNQFIENF